MACLRNELITSVTGAESSCPPSNRQPRRYAKQQLVCDTTALQPADRDCAAR